MPQISYIENPERDQDRLTVTVELFRRTGQVLFPENLRIYQILAFLLRDKNVLDVGCGIGSGSALLERHNEVVAIDKFPRNIALAKALYPWVNFEVGNVVNDGFARSQVTVCIDVIEHIRDYEKAMANMINSTDVLWLSTPNRNNPGHGQTRPHNDFHVKEFTPDEIIAMAPGCVVRMYDWQSFHEVKGDSIRTPLVYKIIGNGEVTV